jgi:hypothetical protein
MVCLIAVGEDLARDPHSHLGERSGNGRHFANKIDSIQQETPLQDVNSKKY